MTDEQLPDDIDKEARELTPERATQKLRKLVSESATFEAFKARLSDRLWWYLGEPMPEPFRSWTFREFEQFYNENKR
jgi:hypothetical protein